MENAVALKDAEETRSKISLGRSAHARKNRISLSALTAQFQKAWRKGVEGLMEAGGVLNQGKEQLEHGKFTHWVEHKLGLSIRHEEMLMSLAQHEVISKSCHWHAFPGSPRTLWELTRIPPERLRELIVNKKINSAITRKEAVALRPSKERPRAPKLKREIATLVDACIRLGGADVVLAHIRGLERDREVPLDEFIRAARWAKQKLVEQRKAT